MSQIKQIQQDIQELCRLQNEVKTNKSLDKIGLIINKLKSYQNSELQTTITKLNAATKVQLNFLLNELLQKHTFNISSTENADDKMASQLINRVSANLLNSMTRLNAAEDYIDSTNEGIKSILKSFKNLNSIMYAASVKMHKVLKRKRSDMEFFKFSLSFFCIVATVLIIKKLLMIGFLIRLILLVRKIVIKTIHVIFKAYRKIEEITVKK